MFDHPVILIIVVAAALLRWLSQRSQAGREDSERPTVLGQPIPRGGETQTEEERIRRFLEALGQPAGSTPPPKVAPRPSTRKEVLPPLPSPLPPLTTVPPPLPVFQTSTIPTPPPPPIKQRIFKPAMVQEAAFEVRDLSARTSSDLIPDARRAPVEQQDLLFNLRSAQGLRGAIVLREIFGPPRSLQTLDPISGF